MGESLHLEAPWDEVKERLKEINTNLTDDDLNYNPGDEERLLDHLASILHRSRESVRHLIESVSANRGKAS
jgi:hypothetical protein